MTEIAVVFLARGRDAGLDAARTFFDSYRSHPAGIDHQLFVLTKGWEGVNGREEVLATASALDGMHLEVPDDGFDIGAYFRVLPALNQEWLCVMNTHSRIIANHWLAILFNAAQMPNVGAAGATGSWESPSRSVKELEAPQGMVGRLRHVARVGYNTLMYPSFPNPHLRSNALLIKTDLLRRFSRFKSVPRHKRDAQRLESGRFGLSSFIRRRHLDLVVCGADGTTYRQSQWRSSQTFRLAEQVNLLVEDNQTRLFARATPARRQALQRAAWGAT